MFYKTEILYPNTDQAYSQYLNVSSTKSHSSTVQKSSDKIFKISQKNAHRTTGLIFKFPIKKIKKK